MHRILMYADVSDAGLEHMEKEIIASMSGIDYDEDIGLEPLKKPIELNLEWISWQLEDERFKTKEEAWKIMYFLINNDNFRLVQDEKILFDDTLSGKDYTLLGFEVEVKFIDNKYIYRDLHFILDINEVHLYTKHFLENEKKHLEYFTIKYIPIYEIINEKLFKLDETELNTIHLEHKSYNVFKDKKIIMADTIIIDT